MGSMSEQPMAKVAKQDESWVSPEVATEVLRREASHEQPVLHRDLLEDLED